MKSWKLILILSLLAQTLFGQTQKECEKLLKKEILYTDLYQNRETFLSDFKTLIDCYFDPMDYTIFVGLDDENPDIVLAIEGTMQNHVREKTTFDDIRHELLAFKDSPEYRELRGGMEIAEIFLNKKISIKNWEIDSMFLVGYDMMKPNQINKIRQIVFNNQDPNLTYADLMFKYKTDIFSSKASDIKIEQSVFPDDMVMCAKGLYAYGNYEKGFRKAKENNKPVLLYFTGRTCANSRELERIVLEDREIQNIINARYILIQLYVDDKTALSSDEIYYSKVLKKDVKTKGDINYEIEVRDFDTFYQPFLCFWMRRESLLANKVIQEM